MQGSKLKPTAFWTTAGVGGGITKAAIRVVREGDDDDDDDGDDG